MGLTGDGQVRLTLRHPWRDGTTAFVFDPVEFLGRLAVLVPRPRVNLLLYYGVLGARSAWRRDIVAGAGGGRPTRPGVLAMPLTPRPAQIRAPGAAPTAAFGGPR